MSPYPSPPWPRLAAHVLARRHVIDGQSAVILFDARSDEVLKIGDREWEILAAADGTRGIDGIVVAAGRRGVRVDPEEVARFIASLAERGLMAEEADPFPVVTPDEASSEPPPNRPVVALPGFSLHCDRSGRCCQMYSTVLMTLAEAERARTIAAGREFGPVASTRAFLPVRGSVVAGAVAVTACDGACGYLDPNGACSLHAAAGPQAKPQGCRVYPATFIDDGVAVRVSVKTECACVLDSAGRPGGEPLVAHSVTRAAELSPTTVVDRLPDALPITPAASAPRAAVRTWTAAWLSAAAPTDVALGCWALADALPAGLDASLDAWSDPEPSVAVAEVHPYMVALARRASARSRIDAQWRSTRDRVRRVGSWIATSAVLCSDATLLGEVLSAATEQHARERFFIRAAAYGYAPFDAALGSLQAGLRDLAVRVWLARAMATLADVDNRDEEALSALDGWLRAYGVSRYIGDV